MDLCGNEAPLMWLANSRGKSLVMLKTEAERQIDELKQELHAERQRSKILAEVLQGSVVA